MSACRSTSGPAFHPRSAYGTVGRTEGWKDGNLLVLTVDQGRRTSSDGPAGKRVRTQRVPPEGPPHSEQTSFPRIFALTKGVGTNRRHRGEPVPRGHAAGVS